MNFPYISIIAPVYKCSVCLPELCSRLEASLLPITSDFEIILVNDGSPDDAWANISRLSAQNPRVKGINLSRNFGQHYAITAGLEHAQGEWIVVMDCDLQDQPEEITKLYAKSQEGYDVVLGRRQIRHDSFFKRLGSKLFYQFLGYLTETKQDSSIANFGIYHRKVIKAILSMHDSLRYFPTMVRWVGFKQTAIDIQHAPRTQGKTSYSFGRLLRLSIDVMLAFSDKPLRLVVKLGFFIALFAVLATIIILIRFWQGAILVPGWASTIISIWFLSGLIIFVLGVVGLYVGKTFERVKQRPLYIVDKTLNINN